MKAIAVIGGAFVAIWIGWAVHPGLGIGVALLAYPTVDSLLSE